MDDAAEGVLGVPLPESSLFCPTITNVSAGSRRGASLWTYFDRYAVFAMCLRWFGVLN